MKTMTCKQLGGACDKAFRADSFKEIAKQSKKHGMEMYREGDEAHIKAMQVMQQRMKSPETMKEWFEKKKKEFRALPDED